MPSAAPQSDMLRQHVQRFFRTFGVLSPSETPCGKPLAISHAHALMVLLEHQRAGVQPRQKELGAALGINKSNVVRLCQKMEQAGHVTLTVCAQDARARRVALTARGETLAASVEQASRVRFTRLLSAIPERDRRAVLQSLEQLNAAVATLVSDEESA